MDTDNNNAFEEAKDLLLKSLPENTIFKKEKFSNFVMSGSVDKFQRIIYKRYQDLGDPIEEIYLKYLGRKPDKGGYEHYSEKLKKGTKLDEIEKSIKNSNEYKELN